MADIAKVKRNIQRMIDQNAPESDIDEYVTSEGTTPEELRGVQSQKPPPQGFQPFAQEAYQKSDFALPDIEVGKGAKARRDFDNMSPLLKPFQAAADMSMAAIDGASFGYAPKALAKLNEKVYGLDYDKNLAEQRSQLDDSYARSGLAGVGMNIAGSMGPVGSLIKRGVTTTAVPYFGKYLGMATDGAALGALAASGNDQDIRSGAMYGAAGGAAGQAIAGGVSKIAEKIAAFKRSPTEQAAAEINMLVQSMKGDPAAFKAEIDALGPDAMLIDALGERGGALARRSANINPDARELLETPLQARKSSQNVRMANDIGRLTGLDAANVPTVEALKKSANDASRPAINAAYREAKAAGFDLDLKDFSHILETPMGASAKGKGLSAVRNRAFDAPQPENANLLPVGQNLRNFSNLEWMDNTKRALDDVASSSYRSGLNDRGSQASELAKALRGLVDDRVPEYAGARELRQSAYRKDDAFDLGQALGRGRIDLDTPRKVADVSPENRDAVKQAFGSELLERLLNKNSTEGALNMLDTPMFKDASKAVIGDSSDDLARSLVREKTFNKSLRSVSGNSTTARQLAEMVGGGMVGGAGALATGRDLMTGGVAGAALGLTRRGGRVLLDKMASGKSRAVAPELAKLLTQKVLPKTPEKSKAQKLIDKNKELLARLIMGGAIGASQ